MGQNFLIGFTSNRKKKTMKICPNQIFSAPALLGMLFIFFCAMAHAQHGVIDYYASLTPTSTAVPLEPLLEYPLTDTSITLGGDGYYYMTGSRVEGEKAVFSKSVTIRRSADMKSWQTVRILTFANVAVSAPEIHFKNNNYWIMFSVNNGLGIVSPI